MTESEAAIAADAERLKAQIKDLETRITMMRARRVQRKYYRLGREREIRDAVRKVIEELEKVIPRGSDETKETGERGRA